MKQRPMLYNTEMVQAISDDRKTKTRRIKGLEEYNKNPDDFLIVPRDVPSGFQAFKRGNTMGVEHFKTYWDDVKCPYGKIGDILYVREKWKLKGWDFEDGMVKLEYADGKHEEHFPAGPGGTYLEDLDEWISKQIEKLELKGVLKLVEADEEDDRFEFTDKHQPFCPGIHLPKWGSRIWLQITDIRVERLQDISEEDIISEGVRYLVSDSDTPGMVRPMFKLGVEHGAIEFMPDGWQSFQKEDLNKALLYAHFAELWCKLNGFDSWQLNPWVWVISFKRIDNPNDNC